MSPTFERGDFAHAKSRPIRHRQGGAMLEGAGASIRRLASSRLKTTGSVRATRTWLHLAHQLRTLEGHIEKELQSGDRCVESDRRDARSTQCSW